MLSLRGRLLLKLAVIKSDIKDKFATFYLDFTTDKYSNIQYLSHKLNPSSCCITFKRYYLFSKYWTPIMKQINPATIPIKRPIKLGLRWGGDAWLKKQY